MQKLFVMVGIPGSGKSTWAENYIRNHSNTVIVSADKIRKEWYGDTRVQGDGKKIFKHLFELIDEEIANGKDVIVDNTSTDVRSRKFYMTYSNRAEIIAVYLNVDKEIAITSNANRERIVPVEVIERMSNKLTVPTKVEGFSEIINVTR